MKSTKKYKITKSSDFAIKLVGVSKKYTIHHEKPTLMEALVKGKTEEFWALKNINLEIKKGEKVGIIGPNGAGKTTLLKIISGITTPTTGKVETFGKVVSLIDLEAGFHPDLSGLQNIYLNGLLLGLYKGQIDDLIKRIIKFADIKRFIDAPLFTYSNGMKLRLGFSIAIHANADTLILDESMAAGDYNFQRKAIVKLKQFFSQGKTIIVVSHWLDFIKQNCQKVYLMDKGLINGIGDKKLIDFYEKKI